MSGSGDPDPPRVTICLLNYNGAAHIDRCVRAIARLRGVSFEVIGVDNASPDGSGTQFAERFAKEPQIPFRYVARPVNDGYGPAHNAAAALARGEYLAFVNVTTELEPEWLGLVEWLDAEPDIAFAQGPVLHASDRDRIESLGTQLDRTARLEVIGMNRLASLRLNHATPLKWEITTVLGAAFVGRRSAFVALGGFDPSFFLYFEETELCWRAWRAGWRVVFATDPQRPMRAYHTIHGTVPSSVAIHRLFNRNRTDTWLRYSERLPPKVVARHFVRALDDLSGSPRALLGYVGDVARSLPHLSERRRAAPPAKVPDARYLTLPIPAGFHSMERPEQASVSPRAPTLGASE
ncbi:MAG: glycosyltransferase [Thermoplasmata archaeon]|nr:glycosyltransferase [Thermoplasmata archaeon]